MPALDPLTSAYWIAAHAHCRHLDDEVVVYLADRCETHRLDDTAWQVLQAIQALGQLQRLATPPALADRLLDEPESALPVDGAAGPSARHTAACLSLAPVLAALVDIGLLTVTAC